METLRQIKVQGQLLRGELDQSIALNYILAEGNSKNMKRYFTIVDNENNVRFTYKVTNMPDNKNLRFVKVLTGSDNISNYKYFAFIKMIGESFTYTFGNLKSKVSRTSPSVELFEKVLAHLRAKRKMANIEIWHDGKCCRCGRKLTVPSSVQAGIGPECSQF